MDQHARVRQLIVKEQFDEALGLLRSIERERPLRVEELVLKGRLLQLADHGNLEAAEEALTSALAQEDSNLDAMLELAHLYYAVSDDAAKALPLFARALELSRGHLTAAIEGVALCTAEEQSTEDAEEFLARARRSLLSLDFRDEEVRRWFGNLQTQRQ